MVKPPPQQAGAVAEAMMGRQAASFLLGCVAALTLVLLLQRRPEELARAPLLQVFGGAGRTTTMSPAAASPSSSSSSSSSPPAAAAGDEYAAAQRQTTTTTNAAATKPTTTPAAAADTSTASATGDPCLSPPNSTTHHGKQHQQGQGAPTVNDDEEGEFRGLAAALSRATAAADDRTVIITCVNSAWAAPGSLLDLFLESFRAGEGTAPLLRQLLVVAMDPAAMARCATLHRHCYHYAPPLPAGVDLASAKFFMSKDYLELVWSKLRLHRRVLQLGYSFLFTDVDILWFRNPLKQVTAYADMSVSSDLFFGDPDNVDNFPNTGFFHMRPNARTVAMTKAWHEARARYPGLNEQPVFNAIKKGLVADLGLRLQYMDPAFVSGFCSYGRDLRKVCTMHANCCVGIQAKLRDLRTLLDDWKNYTAMPHWAKQHAKWTVPGACIH